MTRYTSLFCLAAFGTAMLSALSSPSFAMPTGDGVAAASAGIVQVTIEQPRTFFVTPNYEGNAAVRCDRGRSGPAGDGILVNPYCRM